MLYKVTPMGYFGRVNQITRGPWFKELNAEDDGLEWFYVYADDAGIKYLLSNNMAEADRSDFARLFHAHNRASGLAMFGGFYLGFECVSRMPYFRGMAYGWKAASFFAVAYGFKTVFNMWNAQTYGPLLGAYLRKYSHFGTPDPFEIQDRKREFYEIDTSSYMNYDLEDLKHEHMHVNHGPQPDGEAADGTWYHELDAFLSGKENHLKEHSRYNGYSYDFKDKSFPSLEQAADLINKH